MHNLRVVFGPLSLTLLQVIRNISDAENVKFFLEKKKRIRSEVFRIPEDSRVAFELKCDIKNILSSIMVYTNSILKDPI